MLFAGEVDQYEDLLPDMQGLCGGRGWSRNTSRSRAARQ